MKASLRMIKFGGKANLNLMKKKNTMENGKIMKYADMGFYRKMILSI